MSDGGAAAGINPAAEGFPWTSLWLFARRMSGARDISERLGTTLDEMIAKALRKLDQRTRAVDALEPAQQAELDAILVMVAEARAHVVPVTHSDHGRLYDWDGLPA